MNIQLMSDLHFESHYDGGASFLASLDPSGVDVLVVAGDMVPVRYGRTPMILAELADKYPYVVYVPGNHEFYGTSIRDGMAMLRSAAMEARVHLLESYLPVEIEGKRFLGDTMWFPWSVEADDRENKRFINDFRLIGDCDPVAFDKNDRFRHFLALEMQKSDIVVSHHLPVPGAIAPQWARSRTNCYFLSDMTDLIMEREPALWMFGHTHQSMDLTVGSTRIVSNPLGYPGEHYTSFNGKCILEVP